MITAVYYFTQLSYASPDSFSPANRMDKLSPKFSPFPPTHFVHGLTIHGWILTTFFIASIGLFERFLVIKASKMLNPFEVHSASQGQLTVRSYVLLLGDFLDLVARLD